MKYKKYTETSITRALKKLSKGKGFNEVAKDSGINVHTLRYYAKKNSDGLNPAKVAASKLLRSRKKQKTSNEIPFTSANDFATLVSKQVIAGLKQIFA